jgi:hypothetical protein
LHERRSSRKLPQKILKTLSQPVRIFVVPFHRRISPRHPHVAMEK